jgi:hypothetical protein
VGLRSWVKRLERGAQEEMIVIPQRDGTVARFPQSAARDAFINLMDRMGAGEDAPPEHPLIAAARNSSERGWSESIYAVEDPEAHVAPVEDLSEGARE